MQHKQNAIAVYRDISGGARIKFGRDEIVLSPDDVYEFCEHLFKAINVDLRLEFPKPQPGIIAVRQ